MAGIPNGDGHGLPWPAESDTPVLVVGAGPAGGTTALFLGQYGIPCIVISKHSGTANTPRAHIFNQRAMEVLRDAGLSSRLRDLASSASHMEHTSWLHSFEGQEYGRVYAWGNRPDRKGDYEIASPCVMSDLPQSLLEPVLVEEAEKLGAELRFSTEFISQRALPDGRIETEVKHRPTGHTGMIRSQYLIGADGGRSSVLDSAGIQIIGKQLNTAFNVHIKADLSRYLQHRPGSLNWILNPDAPNWSAVGNFRMVRPWNEFVVSMHPSSKDGKPFEPTEEDILSRLQQMIGTDQIPLEILSTFRWTINNQVAETWQKGNIICIGDAVHRHPPINGLGSNTCISDAMNVAWKLAYVLRGIASPSILDTVTIERKPVGDWVVRRANEGMEVNRNLWQTLGLSQEERKERTALMAAASEEGAALRAQLREALEKTDDEYNALGIQMNQFYCDSPAVMQEDDDFEKPNHDSKNLLKEQIISTYPGHHLPHVWIAKNGQSQRISTLDVCGHGAYTILTGIGGDAWREHSEAVQDARPGLEINVVSIGWDQDYIDAYMKWVKVRGVEEEGAVLVRPDHFVAWRCKRLPAEGSAKLLRIFDTILPRPT